MKQRDLLDDDSKPRPRPPSRYTETQQLTGFYRAEYQKRFGETPVIEPRDAKILKDLIGQFGAPKVRSRLSEYLRWEDEYVANAGYPLWLFRRDWNRLTSVLLKRTLRNGGGAITSCSHRPRCRTAAEHTKKRLADLKK